jgi:hypothetical protein
MCNSVFKKFDYVCKWTSSFDLICHCSHYIKWASRRCLCNDKIWAYFFHHGPTPVTFAETLCSPISLSSSLWQLVCVFQLFFVISKCFLFSFFLQSNFRFCLSRDFFLRTLSVFAQFFSFTFMEYILLTFLFCFSLFYIFPMLLSFYFLSDFLCLFSFFHSIYSFIFVSCPPFSVSPFNYFMYGRIHLFSFFLSMYVCTCNFLSRFVLLLSSSWRKDLLNLTQVAPHLHSLF